MYCGVGSVYATRFFSFFLCEEKGEEEIEREMERGFFQRYYKFSECSCYIDRSVVNTNDDLNLLSLVD